MPMMTTQREIRAAAVSQDTIEKIKRMDKILDYNTLDVFKDHIQRKKKID